MRGWNTHLWYSEIPNNFPKQIGKKITAASYIWNRLTHHKTNSDKFNPLKFNCGSTTIQLYSTRYNKSSISLLGVHSLHRLNKEIEIERGRDTCGTLKELESMDDHGLMARQLAARWVRFFLDFFFFSKSFGSLKKKRKIYVDIFEGLIWWFGMYNKEIFVFFVFFFVFWVLEGHGLRNGLYLCSNLKFWVFLH